VVGRWLASLRTSVGRLFFGSPNRYGTLWISFPEFFYAQFGTKEERDEAIMETW